MQLGLYIIVEEEFDDPIYADPDPEELDEALWERACELVHDALEGDGDARGFKKVGDKAIGWRTLQKVELSFVVIVTSDVRATHVETFLKELGQRYFDEVDDVRRPERAGVADVVIDVIPPWEEEEDD